MEILLEIIFVIFLVLLNGFFVASELALVAVRKTRINELVKKGNKSAKLVQKALENVSTFISATQLGITLASLALGWIGEPVIAGLLEPSFNTFLPNEAAIITSHAAAFAFAFIIITSFHIVIGELVPKNIALQKAEKASLFLIAPFTLFMLIFKPFIWFINKLGDLVTKALGFSSSSEEHAAHSEEEIKMILAQSAEQGAIEKNEAEMVYSVLKFGDLPVKQIMTHRIKIIAFDTETPLRKLLAAADKKFHSRFPIYKESIDEIVGFVHIKEIYKFVVSDPKLKIMSGFYKTFLKKDTGIKISQTGLMRDVLHVPESRRIDDVLLDMRKKRVHMAVVNDEYGGTAGIVTMEDIMESLVGEIHDEFDQPDKEIKKQKNGVYLVDSLTPLEGIRSRFNLPIHGEGYSTIGGLVFGLLGHKPKKGDKLELGNVIIEISEMDKNRIKSLIFKKISK